MNGPVSMDHYLDLLLSGISPLPPRAVTDLRADPLSTLSSDAIAQRAVPPFDNSAVDGYLIARTDVAGTGPWTLPVSGDVPAGSAPGALPPGHALRVMTGAPVPRGADLIVVPVEDTDSPADLSLPPAVTVCGLRASKSNIRRAGEHLDAGQVAVRAGTPLDAGTVAALISAGAVRIDAHPCPVVTVVTTGDEVGGGGTWSIPNSNGPMVVEALRCLLLKARHIHVPDEEEHLIRALDRAHAESDLIVTVGGISAGAFDVVKAVGLRTSSLTFTRVAMRPGGPQGHGAWRTTPVVCLPGNPLATWVSLHLFGIPVIRRLAGAPAQVSVTQRAHLRLKSDRDIAHAGSSVTLHPVTIDWASGTAHSRAHRSHMVGALAGCTGIAVVRSPVAAGEGIDVIVLQAV
ncbi:molybdopterin molybdotransferase MoeA [Corynebacterium pacaense]|uniref:molybdopterin molybdotransferase MoeA n=1 Tax=Corynebacterium pacaense TaxID=1816684 RepID=UPI0009B9C564|nr:molybdopterin molybdotransferase MoeA [Corynebacterium pacaense]